MEMRCSSITLNEINSDLRSGFAALKPLQINQAAVILSKIPAINKTAVFTTSFYAISSP